MNIQAPWAILLCKFKSSPPGTVLINPNLDFKTICRQFFSSPNAGFNAVRFFADMSHQKLDLSGSKVFGWYTLNTSISNYNAAGDPVIDNGKTSQTAVVEMAKQAARDAGVDLASFAGVVVIMDIATGWAQGWPSGQLPKGNVAADWRRVDARNADGTKGVPAAGGGNGTEVFAQEMAHGFGMEHSRKDGSEEEYQDRWDSMSTLNANSAADNDYGARGPGLNAWNMRSRGWIEETRVWHCPQAGFLQTVQLRPLYRTDLPGMLAAELGPVNSTAGFPKYLIEFRKKQGWDIGIPRSCVLVHRFQVDNNGPLQGDMNSRSYIMPGIKGNYDLTEGDVFESGDGAGPFSRLRVVKIDEANDRADIELSFTPQLPAFKSIKLINNADNRMEAFALGKDGSVFHKWQVVPNGGWSRWAALGGHDIFQIEAAANKDGRIELFALGGDRALYHIWQTAPNGTWSAWAGLAGQKLQQITLGRNSDGRLEVFALGGDRAVYHIWQTVPNGGWSGWAGLGGNNIQQLTAATNADGRMEIFALGGDKAAYHIWQAVPNGGWSQWAGLGGRGLGALLPNSNKDGRLEIFALGADAALYHIWQTVPNGGWSGWAGLNGQHLQQITAAKNLDGRIEVFALGGDQTAYHIWQTIANGNWGSWASLQGKDLRYLATGMNADGRIELFAIGGDGNIYHRWQLVPNGGWGDWGLL